MAWWRNDHRLRRRDRGPRVRGAPGPAQLPQRGLRPLTTWSYRPLEVNGAPAYLVLDDGRPETLVQADVADGLVRALYLVRNPEKLRRLVEPRG